jgi:hypothetical protein
MQHSGVEHVRVRHELLTRNRKGAIARSYILQVQADVTFFLFTIENPPTRSKKQTTHSKNVVLHRPSRRLPTLLATTPLPTYILTRKPDILHGLLPHHRLLHRHQSIPAPILRPPVPAAHAPSSAHIRGQERVHSADPRVRGVAYQSSRAV